MKKLLVLLLFLTLGVCVSSVSAKENLDLSPYSNMDLNVYQNSRVNGITQNHYEGTFTITGYMFESGANATKNVWREIIFVNEDNPSPEHAYRMQVTPVYNTFLNKNATASQNGKYDLSYANYSVKVNPRNIKKYDNVTYAPMEVGNYSVYMRISSHGQSYLFPLKDLILSDGSTVESTSGLPNGLYLNNRETRELSYAVSVKTAKFNDYNTSSDPEYRAKKAGTAWAAGSHKADGVEIMPNMHGDNIFSSFEGVRKFTGTSTYEGKFTARRENAPAKKAELTLDGVVVDTIELSDEMSANFQNEREYAHLVFEFPSFEGNKHIEVRFIDANGNLSEKHSSNVALIEDYEETMAVRAKIEELIKELRRPKWNVGEDVTDYILNYIDDEELYFSFSVSREGKYEFKNGRIYLKDPNAYMNLSFIITYRQNQFSLS